MEFLYRLKLVRLEMFTSGPTPYEMETMAKHLEYLKDLASQGKLILAGRTQLNDERTMGIAIFRADSEDEARQIMENDPAVSSGLMTAELFPYQVAVAGRFSD